jgi:hypothetical protein
LWFSFRRDCALRENQRTERAARSCEGRVTAVTDVTAVQLKQADPAGVARGDDAEWPRSF